MHAWVVAGAHEPTERGQVASNYCKHVVDKVLSDRDLIRKVVTPTVLWIQPLEHNYA